jgi:hypothetical protein
MGLVSFKSGHITIFAEDMEHHPRGCEKNNIMLASGDSSGTVAGSCRRQLLLSLLALPGGARFSSQLQIPTAKHYTSLMRFFPDALHVPLPSPTVVPLLLLDEGPAFITFPLSYSKEISSHDFLPSSIPSPQKFNLKRDFFPILFISFIQSVPYWSTPD